MSHRASAPLRLFAYSLESIIRLHFIDSTLDTQTMTRNTLCALSSLSLLLTLCGCEDPKVALRAAAEVQIREAGIEIALNAKNASVDRVAAAESLRMAGARLSGLTGATMPQEEAAASLVATATTQAAALEIGHADQLASENHSVRSLAHALLHVLANLDAFAAAQRNSGLAKAQEQLTPQLADASSEQDVVNARQVEFASAVAALRAEHQRALSEAQRLAAEAEEIRLRGVIAPWNEITVIAVEAGSKRDEARVHETLSALAESAVAHGESVQRVQSSEATGASTRVQAIQSAIGSLDRLVAIHSSSATDLESRAEALRASIRDLTKRADPQENKDLVGCYERALGDLDAADTAARRAGENTVQFTVAAARARALLSRGEGEFQQALLLHALASGGLFAGSQNDDSASAAAWLKQAQASTQSAIDVYTELGQALSTGIGTGRASSNNARQSFALAVERSLKSIRMPSFDTAAAPTEIEQDAQPSPAAPEDSPADEVAETPTASAGPPFDTVEELAAFLTDSGRDPELGLRMDEILVAETPEGESLKSMAFGTARAIAALQIAMKEEFGNSDLGPISRFASAQATATVEDATDDTATISIGGATGSISFAAIRIDSQWKLDLDQTSQKMAPQMRAQIEMAGAMLVGLSETIVHVTESIESGEIKSAKEVQATLMQALQKMMMGGGMPSPN
ncbi:MAG: hypothetical protein EXS15_00975 [Phycisphaerales bacterium]|nr:hypothetical protein [Phycisphaerales bacterium]